MVENGPEPIFLRPSGSWVGDVIPFARDGLVNLFFLNDRRDPEVPGTSWNLYTTQDFASFKYEGVSLPHGTANDQDLNAYTGSLVEADGVLHLFYTGQNPTYLIPDTSIPAQVVMHATSLDGMQTWVKHPEHTFGAPDGYSASDWRDPFVFKPETTGPWYMLIASRTEVGPERRRGLIACCVSEDLVSWQIADPFWAPNRYITHECPEVFQIGDWWYLVYSEFSEHFVTRYRMSRSPFGPWTVPEFDSIDGRAFYAAKSVAFGNSRFFAGWIPTREGRTDDGAWQWAGDLAVHQAVQGEDGTLNFKIPSELQASFNNRLVPDFEPVLGRWQKSEGSMYLSVPDAYGVAIATSAPDQFLLELTIDIDSETTECGVLLRASDDGNESYAIRLEPRVGRMVFDRWPRKLTGEGQWQVSGDISHDVALERPIHIAPGQHRLSVIVDGTACVAYLDQKVAMSARIYDRRTKGIGLFVGEGSATFSDISIATRQ